MFRVPGLIVLISEPGVVRAQGGVVAAELTGIPLQIEDLADPGEVDPVGDQLGDPA
jgi:hypothetical protein